MSRTKCFIDDRELVTSSTVLIHKGQRVKVHPFEDDPDYEVMISCIFEEGQKRNIGTRATEDGVHLILSGEFEANSTFGSSRSLNFSSDSRYEYYIAAAAQQVGTVNKYTVLLTYMITKQRKAS